MRTEFLFPTPEAAEGFTGRMLGHVGVMREHQVVHVHAESTRELDEARSTAREFSGTEHRARAENAACVEACLAACTGTRERVGVRLFLGDPETGRDWGEGNDVCGYIGRSMGRIKVPLMLATRHSTGGPAILTGNVLRILVNGREVYRHPKYCAPAWETKDDGPADLPFQVLRDGIVHARFRTEASRTRWLDYMTGRRMAK
jgi:hypothetical protein